MLSHQVRTQFLNYFKKKGHTIVPSSSVVPHDDPTLLFMNAGMNQFKDVFLGKSKRDYSKAVTAQKCIRVGGKHNDLDNVGHTSRHMTFFEMLGNFSFGDYFKKEAIAFAWEVITEIYQFDPAHLWITVFENDDEAFELWKSYMPENRIVRFGEKDNFWTMGDVGPCGPCSEILYDRGEAFGNAKNPHEDLSGERFLEFWNLVFMQFNRETSGKQIELPNKSIDTGSGLERVVALKLGVNTVFETDILRGIITAIEDATGKSYDPKNKESAPIFNVIADHLRSLSFAIADGAQPSNVERGYVLRKILRRAVRYGRLLGFEKPFLADLFPTLLSLMGPDFPELKAAQSRIEEILTVEEESFHRTLHRGGNILQHVIEKAVQSPYKQISGEDAFKLKDTYGFPLEEVLLIAKDQHLTVNLDAYALLEEKAKELSRGARQVQAQQAEENLFESYIEKFGPCTFIGYEHHKSDAAITAIYKEGRMVDQIEEGEKAEIILDKTPFYAEKGGQVCDYGQLIHKNALFIVEGCQNPFPGVIVHSGYLKKGTLLPGEPVEAGIDVARRLSIANYHTATHLLHFALEKVLGPHIKQAGSLVEAKKLRFDFNHHKPLSPQEIREVEKIVNEKIRLNPSVSAYELPYEKVQKRADIKQFFGEKYGSEVRVIDIDDISKELCGGTHVKHLGSIGLFRIAKEGSIAAGVRRIEAVVGEEAEKLMYEGEDYVQEIAALLQVKKDLLKERVEKLVEEHKYAKAQIKAFREGFLRDHATHLLSAIKKIGMVPVLATSVDVEPAELAQLGNDLMAKMQSGIILLALPLEDRCQLLLKVSPDLVTKGFEAAQLIKQIAPLVGGSGGGKKDSAQAGGSMPEKIPEALSKLYTIVQALC